MTISPGSVVWWHNIFGHWEVEEKVGEFPEKEGGDRVTGTCLSKDNKSALACFSFPSVPVPVPVPVPEGMQTTSRTGCQTD